MLGEREARGKSIHSVKKTLELHEMASLPLAAEGRSAENDKRFYLMLDALAYQAMREVP